MKKYLASILLPFCLGSSARQVHIVDLHASFREIWLGLEQSGTGKEAEPTEHVTLHLDSPTSGNVSGLEFFPVAGQGCDGPIVAAVSQKTIANRLELAPQKPLRRGCSYEFVVPESAPIARNGASLATPLRVRFRVAAAALTPAQRELEPFASDPVTKTLRSFSARPGINTPVRAALERYQDEIGIPASDLRPFAAAAMPALASNTEAKSYDQYYRQYRGAYLVAGYGYMISARNDIFGSAFGKVMPKLPAFGQPRVSEAAALKRVAIELAPAVLSWDVPDSHIQKPRGVLELVQNPPNTPGAPFVPVWHFDLPNSGTDWRYVEVDVRSGKVVRKKKIQIVE